MPDFVDPPDLQNAPICSGSLRPKTNVQKHAHRYCVKSSSQPNQCSSQPDRSDYLTGKKSATKRSADKANEKKRYSKGFWKAIQCRLGIPPTGTPGPETRRAIMSWQDAHGKPTNGVINDRILNDLGLSANQLRINPKTVTIQQLRERLGENYTPSQHFDHGPATITLDRNHQLKCPTLPANHQPPMANYSFADAPNHFANLPKPLETLGIAALRGNPLWNAKPESSNRARQPQSSDALAPNDANHAIVERLKSPENYHIERENVLNLDTVDDTIAKRLIILEIFNTKANGEAWEELVQYAQSDSTEAHQVMQSVVDYVIKELHKLESQGDRKEAAVRHIHASDKYGEDEAAVAQDKDKLLWVKERERVSKWLLGLSKLYQDPAFAALAFQGTHYAGLEGTVIDEQTGHPIRVPNEAQAIQSKKSADSFAKTGNMSNLYRTGAVCNEFAYASSSIANPTSTKNAFPISISKSNWYSPALAEQERYKTNFDDIEQGDAIVALNPRQNDKSRKNDNPPSLEELSKYTGRHVDIVVAVGKRNPPKKKKGNKADREQDEQPKQKAVMLAGARGSNYPNGIHSTDGKTKWYFRDDDKFKQPFIVIKSVRKHHSIDLSTALTQDFKYDDVKSDIAYSIMPKYMKPYPNTAIIHHSSESNHICLGDNKIGYNDLVDIMEDIPSNERSSHYIDAKNIEALREFKKSLNSIINNEQRLFLFEHLRNNIHSEMQSFDINETPTTQDSIINHTTPVELEKIDDIINIGDANNIHFFKTILIFHSLPSSVRERIISRFTSASTMSFNVCPIHSSSLSSESKRQIATKNIWRSKR
ncbi:MAG: hypothetical protein KIG72_03160 [Bradymonadales bacterium]|nr:hypothetical protein [Bradymonadales bacterium]